MKKTITICDDHLLFLQGIESLLKDHTNFQVKTFSSPLECIEDLKINRPAIFICDLNLDKTDAFEILTEVRSFLANTKIIILTSYNEEYLCEKAKKMGASAFLLKTTPAEELIHILESDLGIFQTNIAGSEPSASFTRKDENFKKKFVLSKKEIEIVKLVVKGKTSQEIADTLFLSKFTVETHRRNIGKKLGISGITSLIEFARENNMLD